MSPRSTTPPPREHSATALRMFADRAPSCSMWPASSRSTTAWSSPTSSSLLPDRRPPAAASSCAARPSACRATASRASCDSSSAAATPGTARLPTPPPATAWAWRATTTPSWTTAPSPGPSTRASQAATQRTSPCSAPSSARHSTTPATATMPKKGNSSGTDMPQPSAEVKWEASAAPTTTTCSRIARAGTGASREDSTAPDSTTATMTCSTTWFTTGAAGQPTAAHTS